MQKRAAEVEVIRRMIKTVDTSLVGLRARAILLLGFAGAFRRSELAGLTAADLEEVAEGMIVTLRRSKSDQAGAGAFKPIAYGDHPETCPIRALRAWLNAAGITDGPIFRPFKRNGQVRNIAISGHAINAIVKEAAEAAGYAPKDLGGHTLRSGFATTAAKIGASEKDIMDVTGHRSTTMLRRYIRRGSLFQNNATKVGL